jgi:two-component system nitrogen regulation sensor histidine kinase GlnL
VNRNPAAPAPSGRLHEAFEAFDLLGTMVLLAETDGRCIAVNSVLETTMAQSRRQLLRANALDWFVDPAPLRETLRAVSANEVSTGRFDGHLWRATLDEPEPLPVHVVVSQAEEAGQVLVEMIELEQQLRQGREERMRGQAFASKELVRNLAHEIKNPLGGIRGAAQLLAMDIDSPELTEYTQVIIQEADRLQALVDRMLAPHRRARIVGAVNIHEVCEHVRALVLAEFPRGLAVVRDYDISLPELRGDREQLIQAVLNIVRNACQVLAERIAAGDARIVLRTRAARQVTIHRVRHRLALELHIEDNGPGVPEDIRDYIFQPLVSGREGGSGLGLTLAQTFVQEHHGTIGCESVPGRTDFTIILPVPQPEPFAA